MGGLLSRGLEVATEEAPTLFRSMEHIASATEAGKLWVSTVKNDLEPLIGKTRQSLLSGGMPAEQAMSQAKQQVKEAAFGRRNQAMYGLLSAAEKQGGVVAAQHLADAHNIYWAEDGLKGSAWRGQVAKDVVDKQSGTMLRKGIPINTGSAYSGHTKLETTLKDFSRTTQLPMVSIPHALQAPLNGLAVNGWRAGFAAAKEFMTDPASAKAFAMKAGAMSQEFAYEMLAAQKKTSTFSLLLDPMKKLFSMERRAGVAYSAVMGKHAAMEAADTFFKSGGKDKAAEMQLKVLGQDVNSVMQNQGRLSNDDMERAAFRSASEVMGFRSPLETPMAWEKNAAFRIGATYKQYGYRTMRLHQQVLQRAYGDGGLIGVGHLLQKAATYGTVFFLGGELIKGAEGAITGQNAWDAEHQKRNLMHNEYLDALAAGMGFNLIYGATRSSTFHNLANFISGPIISTGTDLLQDSINLVQNAGDDKKRSSAARSLAKDVVRRTGLPGRIAYPHLFPPKNTSHY